MAVFLWHAVSFEGDMANGMQALRKLNGLSRYGFPFALVRAKNDVERIRRFRYAERFRGRSHVTCLLLYLFVTLAWPVAALLETSRNVRNLKQRGFSTFFKVLSLALLHNVPPIEYVAYGFESEARRRFWREYLYWTDTDALKRLNRLRSADNRDVQDKARFAQLCDQHGFARAPALTKTRSSQTAHAESIGNADLWLKPRSFQGGVGAELWRSSYSSENLVLYTCRGRALTLQQLLADAESRDCLLQPRLRNHAAIEPFTNGSLAALRLVTACHRSGCVSFLGNLLILPQGDALTTAGGITCRVLWDKGVVDKVLCAEKLDVADKTLGLQLPFWQQSIDLVSRAHKSAFPRFATLGWDVALTPSGPLLLEANSGWGTFALQQHWGPIGLTAFATLLKEEFAAEVLTG